MPYIVMRGVRAATEGMPYKCSVLRSSVGRMQYALTCLGSILHPPSSPSAPRPLSRRFRSFHRSAIPRSKPSTVDPRAQLVQDVLGDVERGAGAAGSLGAGAQGRQPLRLLQELAHRPRHHFGHPQLNPRADTHDIVGVPLLLAGNRIDQDHRRAARQHLADDQPASFGDHQITGGDQVVDVVNQAQFTQP